MKSCPKCKSEKLIWNGTAKGKKKRLCKECGHQFTREIPRGRSLKEKLNAVFLYSNGMSMRAIGKFLKVSTQTVCNWVEEVSGLLGPKPMPESKYVVLELDEFWHYLEKKVKESGSGKLIVTNQKDSSTGKSVIVIIPQ
jgi:transposase-like protein